MAKDAVLNDENQTMVREAYCWNAELQNRMDHEAHAERLRPFHLMKPALFMDGNQWCALYGKDLQEGLVGFGPTPEKAAHNFDRAFLGQKQESSPESQSKGDK